MNTLFNSIIKTNTKIPSNTHQSQLFVFEYAKENISTKKIIDILLDERVFGDERDYNDKNIYFEDIQKINSFNDLFNGIINNKTGEITYPKNKVANMSCIEKFEYLTDIEGLSNGIAKNFFCATYLQRIRLPKTLPIIGNSAFAFCLNLSDIIIPNSVSIIKSRAFFNCVSLKTLTIPSSVVKIENGVFANSGITNIYMEAVNPPELSWNAFANINHEFTIYVPQKSYNAYMDKWFFVSEHIKGI